MFPSTLLDRLLWTQIARVLHGTPPDWDAAALSARAIRRVLTEAELDPEEEAVLTRWEGGSESSRQLFDRLLQTRVNRAVCAGARVEAEKLGLAEVPSIPKVLIVREGGLQEGEACVRRAGNARQTVVDFLGASRDVAALEPGAKLDQLVDLLVLANQDAAEELKGSLGPSASVVRFEEEDDAPIDLLLASPTPSIQVFDIERELARVEDVLRRAIPAERRPAKSGTWSFGQDLTGELLAGKYRIRGLKGKGAFKTVYEGEDEMLGARVAVAVLNPKGARSPRALEHFQDEAKKLTTLDHENIVRWITFDRTAEGLHFFVMEYLDGEELEKVLRREQRLAPKRVAAILLQVLGALRRAHAKGKHGSLLHLDLKPENVFVMPALTPGEPERVKVIDFGIGQHVGAEVRAAEHPELRSIYDLPAEDLDKSIGSLALPEDEAEEEASEELEAQSLNNEVLPSASGRPRRVQRARGGTLLYASPEQCKHLAGHKDIEPLDGRSDLYSLGVMAFRMLTGQYPFARITTAFEAIQNHLEVAPRKVGSLGIKIPRELAAFVDRCLVKDGAKRWRDANEAYEALARIVHPRLSPLRIGLPIGAAALLGLGALYVTRAPLVYGLTLVDPLASLSARGVEELFLGPERPLRRVRLESEAAFAPGTEPRLLDATTGQLLAGWSARWAGDVPGELEVVLESGARSAVATLELDPGGGGLGRGRVWRSERFTLHHLGPWRIERVAVAGHDPSRALDPRGQRLVLELGGDPEGRTALEAVELLLDGVTLGRAFAGAAETRGERVLYAGPALDALHTATARTIELALVARDRAGQEQPATLALRLAGAPADFTNDTGFITAPEAGATLLEASGETLLLAGNALRVAVDAPALAQVFVEPSSTPARTLERVEPDTPAIVTLAELGIAGASDLAGTLRIELDERLFVDRTAPTPRLCRLPFRFTPVAPELSAQLVADGAAIPLREGAQGANPVRVGREARLVVHAPPNANLWVEAEEPGAGEPRRLTRSGAAFELPLALESEGLHAFTVRKFLLLSGDEKGPPIPPEHTWRLEVDRTPPAVRLALEGGTEQGGGRLYRTERETAAQRVVASIDEPALAAVRWTLRRPDGTQAEGTLEPSAELALPALVADQATEGRYDLTVEARDRSGNTGRAAQAWQVAHTGPSLALVEPAASGGRWALGTGRGFDVLVRASDANGVAAVRVRLVRDGVAGPELDLRPAAGELWELDPRDRPSAFPWWTGQELVLELVARDTAGIESTAREHAIVPELRREGLLVIAARGAASPAPMVEIQAGAEYVFGGREGEVARPWRVPIARDALRPYFLDAREVSRGEALAFVRDETGLRDPRLWPEGGAPDAARLAELARALAGDPERPATGLTRAEAQAFALARGKRLPTLLEWEFAVRGASYRVAPASPPLPGLPSDWPANLCAGVREWSATPDRLVADALDFASQCRRHPERLLAPPPAEGRAELASASLAGASPATLHWVTGPGPGEPASFTAVSLRASAQGHADIGFRCALDRESAYRLLDRGEYVIVE